jgi:hypothetical protein
VCAATLFYVHSVPPTTKTSHKLNTSRIAGPTQLVGAVYASSASVLFVPRSRSIIVPYDADSSAVTGISGMLRAMRSLKIAVAFATAASLKLVSLLRCHYL